MLDRAMAPPMITTVVIAPMRKTGASLLAFLGLVTAFALVIARTGERAAAEFANTGVLERLSTAAAASNVFKLRNELPPNCKSNWTLSIDLPGGQLMSSRTLLSAQGPETASRTISPPCAPRPPPRRAFGFFTGHPWKLRGIFQRRVERLYLTRPGKGLHILARD